MNCTTCGQPMVDGASFCVNCGSAAQQPAPPAPPAQYAPPAPPAQYAPYAQPAPPPRGGHGPLIAGIAIAVVVVLAALGVGLYFGLRGDDADPHDGATASSSTASTASSAPSDTPAGGDTQTTAAVIADQQEGEILLEAAGAAGPDSFTGETFVPEGPPPSLNLPTTTLQVTTTTAAAEAPTTIPAATTTVPQAAQVVAVSGGKPALYGGSKDKALADKEGQLAFFEQNPDKAAAFCAALNSDATFVWSGGTQIEPSQLRDYFAELTPLMLTRDTRVTNNGYRDGRPTPRQSVLQKGQMVLVDQYGVPRVRCECGNPLTPPRPVKKTPTYTGPKWPDFDPITIIVIQPTTVIITIFVVVDINTGESFDRPAGTTGADDVVQEPQKLFDNGNIMGVYPGASAPSFVLDAPARITLISTYHYVTGGLAGAGTIGLLGDDGTMYGPFQATGSDGQGGVANANWTVEPDDLVLPAGSYTIIDSDPGTFSQNDDSGGVGMASVWGIPLE